MMLVSVRFMWDRIRWLVVVVEGSRWWRAPLLRHRLVGGWEWPPHPDVVVDGGICTSANA